MLRIRSNHYNEFKRISTISTCRKQYTVDINEVLHYEEEEPFEASCALEDVKHGKTFMINIAKKIIAL